MKSFSTPRTPTPRFCIALVLALGMGSLAALPIACSSGPVVTTPGTCGGVTTDAGKCVAKCEATDCIQDNACVDNQCQLVCDTHLDCQLGQHCVSAMSDYPVDDAGAPSDAGSKSVAICETSGKSANIGATCPLGTECSTLYACPDGTPCDPTSDAGSTCTSAECKVLSCRTTGTADANAYCTMFDCHMDSDCPDGFECGIVRDPHLICGKASPKPAMGGITPCVDPSMYTANGQTYREGPISLLRNQCIKRAQCSPCTISLDCSENAVADVNGNLAPTESCATVGTGLACSSNCSKDGDCSGDFKCTSGQCQPRFGACKGTGKFCEPCANDLDCGGTATNTMICAGLFGDQKACIDDSLPITCTTSSDCPLSPSGKHGVCLDETEEVATTDPSYHRCYFPFNSTTNKYSCW